MSTQRSVFAQLVLVIALTLAGAATLTLLLGREFAARPATGRMLQAIGGLASAVEALDRRGQRPRALRLLRDAGVAVRVREPAAVGDRILPVMRRFERHARASLGPGRELRLGEGAGGTVLWLRLDTAPPLWLALVDDGRSEGRRRFSALMLAGCVVLVWLAAAYFARKLVSPLRALAASAPALLRGEDTMPATERAPAEVFELGQALSRAGREMRDAAEERALMLAGISHDLRTPLTRVQFALELLPDTDPELRAGIARDVGEIDAILSQFIAFARDGRDENSEMLDLAAVCRSAVAAAGGEWEVDAPIHAALRGKPLALLRAVGNLAVNARRHGAAPFALRLWRDGEAWRVEVADHGPGLDREAAERVRQPFVRNEAGDGGRAGSGLGLAIVERVARQHGGALQLLPNTPNGLRAVLSLRGA